MDIRKLLEVLNEMSQNQNFDVDDRDFERTSDTLRDVFENHPLLQNSEDLFDVNTSGFNNLLYEVVEEDKNIVVVADLPGFTEDQISLQADEMQVRIDATATDDMRRESVSHTFSLPEEVVPDEASATFENGVLTITLPRVNVEDDDGHTEINIS